MVQQGTGLRLTISSPTLEVLPVGEDGTVFDRHIAFGFTGDTGYEGWSSTYLQDHLGPTESLGFDGSVDGAVTDAEIRATMDGDMDTGIRRRRRNSGRMPSAARTTTLSCFAAPPPPRAAQRVLPRAYVRRRCRRSRVQGFSWCRARCGD